MSAMQEMFGSERLISQSYPVPHFPSSIIYHVYRFGWNELQSQDKSKQLHSVVTKDLKQSMDSPGIRKALQVLYFCSPLSLCSFLCIQLALSLLKRFFDKHLQQSERLLDEKALQIFNACIKDNEASAHSSP